MKRILLLFLALCLLLCSCIIEDPEESSCESLLNSSEESSSSEIESESEEQSSSNVDKAYLDIERFEPQGFEETHFAIKNSKYVLSFSAPTEWSYTKNGNNQYKILRAGVEIGEVTLGSIADLDSWVVVSKKEKDKKTVIASEYIEKSKSGENAEYRYRWRYFYTEDSQSKEINVIVTCAEVPNLSTYRMLTTSTLKEQQTDPNFGVIPRIESPKILIVGNSFVGTSEIGQILQEMLDVNGKNAYVTPISIGMGNVGKYANDDTVLSEIETGNYDLVIMSGFYSSDDSSALKAIKDVCDNTSAILVTLPAHNENIVSARASSRKCEVKCLEWKTEIDNFINGGVDKWELCYDDSYYHSTPLAGYIGAHMIYRAMYSENPSEPLTVTMSQEEIDAVLGDYSSTGSVKVVKPSLIKYLG